MKHLTLVICLLSAAWAAPGCGDDENEGAPKDAGADTGVAGRSGSGGTGGRGGRAGDGGRGGADGGSNDPTAAMVARGKYLTLTVAACIDCHTPRKPGGAFDETKLLSGVDCFADADPADPDFGCLSGSNLTNHETGLKNRTDQQIKDMFLKGERPADSGGKPSALHPFMPYWVFGNMSDEDASAIVAYLRTVPGVDHRVSARQAPFDVDTAAPRFPDAMIPQPSAGYAERSAAMRGRYLAGSVGICLECHTPRTAMGAVRVDMAFQGGQEFKRAALGLPASFPETIYTSNLTPHATGIEGWSVQDIVNALKKGEDKNQMGTPICPPMPSGPMGAFAGLSDADAQDMAHYLLSMPPREHRIPMDCVAQPPSDTDAGDDAG